MTGYQYYRKCIERRAWFSLQLYRAKPVM